MLIGYYYWMVLTRGNVLSEYPHHRRQMPPPIQTLAGRILLHLTRVCALAGACLRSRNKLTPYGTDGRLFTTDVSVKFKVT